MKKIISVLKRQDLMNLLLLVAGFALCIVSIFMKQAQVGQQELAGYGVAGADGQVSHLQLPGLRQLFLTRFQ